jgi:Tfp pilus assembly protein PilF
MSTTLNLVDRLLARVRHLRRIGRTHDALSLLHRLAAFRELPADIALDAQVQLAELRLDGRHFRRARRHLTAALGHRPDNARYHYLMATAFEGEGRGDLRRAAAHYRRSLELEPAQPECLGSYGRLALRLGRRDEGLACLRRAAELAPDDPETVRRLADGLCLANEADEARAAVRAALFRNPRASRFRQLWSDFQFRQLRREQELAECASDEHPTEQGPVLLPFVRPADNAPRSRRRVRSDVPAPLPEPHETDLVRLPTQRHAL